MTESQMKLTDLRESIFFPGSSITTPFGWDAETFPDAPRIHHAIDRAGPGVIRLPFDAERIEWIGADANGCSVLRAFALDGALELRMLHFIRDELKPEILRSAVVGRGAPAGIELGPAGNKGLSVSTTRGDGRHLHYQLMLRPGAFDAELDQLTPAWSTNQREALAKRWGIAFLRECVTRKITWINGIALERMDPWTGRKRIIIDSAGILGL
jgi:hypothetical protein